MIGQDCDQFVFIFRLEQVFNRTCRQGCKGCVGWGKDGEGSSALQRVHQPCCLHSGDQSGEVASAHGGINDILVGGVRSGRHQRGCGGQRNEGSTDHVSSPIRKV